MIELRRKNDRSYFGDPEGAHYSAGSTQALLRLLLEKGECDMDTPVRCFADTGTKVWAYDYPVKHFLSVQTKPETGEPREKVERAPKDPSGRPSRGVTLKVWETADSMPGATKAEVIAACIERGINPSTASVQYALWSKAQ